MRIALIGHACSPVLGSEPGLTWNWGRSLANHHEVCIFTHPQFQKDIDIELARCGVNTLSVLYVSVESSLDPWKPEKGEAGIRVHYRLWQKAALDALVQAQAKRPFDLVHHVSWGSLQQPPLVWKTGLPFVWGPVGGGQTWPAAFRVYGGNTLSERGRRIVVKLTRFNPLVMKPVRHADLILTTNRETDDLVKQLGAKRVQLYFDNGITEDMIEPKPPLDEVGRNSRALKVMWVGRCELRKGLPLALKAMAQIKNPEVTMEIAGDGPSLDEDKALAQELGLNGRVKFHGRIPRAEVLNLFRRADAFLFTSLRDSTGSVVLEALAKQVPVITLDHQGIGCLITDQSGVKVPVTNEAETIATMARAMERLADNPEERRRLGDGALELAQEHLWNNRAKKMNSWYEEVLHAHRDH
jgi:glycosyltransferase involved in cell wall biosynthesis